MRPRLINAEPQNYSPMARRIIESFAEYGEDLQKLKDAEALIVRFASLVDEKFLRGASRLKVIATAATGLDHIDLKAAKARQITVLSLQGEDAFLDGVHGTAEHCFALILALARHIPAASLHVLEGGWDRDRFIGAELHGHALGVIGLGRLGLKVAGLGLAFGMKVLAADPSPRPLPAEVELVSLDQLLAGSDIVSLHVPLTAATGGLISERQLAAMRKGSRLVNTSRGEIVDAKALLAALQSGHLAGAALDVLPGEGRRGAGWPAGDPLCAPLCAYARQNQNLIITPHIGGATVDSMAKTEIFMAEKLQRFFNSCAKAAP